MAIKPGFYWVRLPDDEWNVGRLHSDGTMQVIGDYTGEDGSESSSPEVVALYEFGPRIERDARPYDDRLAERLQELSDRIMHEITDDPDRPTKPHRSVDQLELLVDGLVKLRAALGLRPDPRRDCLGSEDAIAEIERLKARVTELEAAVQLSGDTRR